LIIFEGALRKWFLTGLATPLLVVRDPLAVWIIVLCVHKGVFKLNPYSAAIWIIGFVAFITALSFGHGNYSVALFGLRIFAIHFPLIFIIGQIFDQRDVIKMGRAMLWISIPMTMIMILQFYSPQTDLINRGLGGVGSAGYWGAMGYYRPSGTFSFTTGLSHAYSLLAAFVLYFWIAKSKSVSRNLLIAGTACMVLSIPFSISRTLFFSSAITAAFAIIAAMRTPRF